MKNVFDSCAKLVKLTFIWQRNPSRFMKGREKRTISPLFSFHNRGFLMSEEFSCQARRLSKSGWQEKQCRMTERGLLRLHLSVASTDSMTRGPAQASQTPANCVRLQILPPAPAPLPKPARSPLTCTAAACPGHNAQARQPDRPLRRAGE